jgi:hypothetical protein
MTDKLEPGVYTDEAGNTKYWDGENWLVRTDAPKRKASFSPRTFRIVVIGVAVALLAGVGFWSYQEFSYQQKVELLEAEHLDRGAELRNIANKAVEICSSSENGFAPSSEGLIINSVGNDNSRGAPYAEMVCVLEELDAPTGTMERVGATTSLQGLIESDWSAESGDLDVSAEWSYHPDPGMTMTLDFSSPYFEDFVPPER